MTAPQQTLVSCLFDLDRRERTGRRPVQFFQDNCHYVLGLELPLVLYLDPDLLEWAAAVRERAGLSHLTLMVARPLEELRLHRDLDAIGSLPTFLNSDPNKDTVLHQLIEWSKFDLLDEVMAEDPFESDHFCWIDFGVGHVARPPERFPLPTQKVGVLEMRAVAPDEITDRRLFYQFERRRIAGGFFRGGRAKLSELCEAFRAELSAALAQGVRPNEQSVLSYLSAERHDLFDFYYGDYPSILANWDLIRGDADTVLLNLVHCRAHGLQARAVDIAARVGASIDAGVLSLSEEQADLLHGGVGPEHTGNESPPLVSVIVAVHNGEATLERAVRSVLDQTWTDLEVVIVDDGSTDGSAAIAQRLAQKNNRVRLIRRSVASGGPATPRDEGIGASSSRYVALLDQDDFWMPDKLARQLPLFESQDAAVVYCDALHEQADGGFARTLHGDKLPEGDILTQLVRGCVVPAITAVIRRDWLERTGRFDRHGLVGADEYYYWLRISLSGGRFAAVQEPLAVHSWSPDGLGHSRAYECFESWHRLWAALAEEFPDSSDEFLPGNYLPYVRNGEAVRSATVALCMIVRNEGTIIERCINSVRPLISHWVICDTGSTDDTVTKLEAGLDGIPGELHHRPWKDFATNRNELLGLAKGTADYLLLLDADMTLSQTGPLRPLAADAYLVRQNDAVEYWVPRLVRGELEWRYEGATHEYLVAPDGSTEERLTGLYVLHHGDGGARSVKLERDRGLLERRLEEAPEDERTHFYLAQTYEGLGDTRRAIDLYRRRGALGGWEEEAWYATYRAASLEAAEDWDRGVAALLAAWGRRPTRVEPLYELARGYRFRELHELAQLFATKALEIAKPPDDILFIHHSAYEWGVLFEWSIAAYWVGQVQESLEASDSLLERELPADIVPYVRHNRRVALSALGLTESGRPPSFPIASTEDLRRLDELAGETRIGEIVLDIESPWPQFNPSIAADGDGFRMLVRTANYFEEDGVYHGVDESDDTTTRTRNYLVSLDSTLSITDVWPVKDRSDHGGRYESPVVGFEDCRLFAVDGRWYASATSREGNPDHRCEQVLLTFDGAQVTTARVLAGPDTMRDEKNWMPAVGPDGLRFVYSCDPTVVLRCDPRSGVLEISHEHPGSAAAGGFRGGSQGVAVEGGTLFVTHEVTAFGRRRVYSHRFVLFDKTWELTAASPPFCFLDATVEFCAGMAPYGDKLVLSFGARDDTAHLAVVDRSRALATLAPLTEAT